MRTKLTWTELLKNTLEVRRFQQLKRLAIRESHQLDFSRFICWRSIGVTIFLTTKFRLATLSRVTLRPVTLRPVGTSFMSYRAHSFYELLANETKWNFKVFFLLWNLVDWLQSLPIWYVTRRLRTDSYLASLWVIAWNKGSSQPTDSSLIPRFSSVRSCSSSSVLTCHIQKEKKYISKLYVSLYLTYLSDHLEVCSK